MCGFVGFRSDKDFQSLRDALPLGTRELRHRGPDDAGLFLDEVAGVGLGHRRLSIIDLSREARQPMASADGEIHVVYNGELYNFKRLRADLEKLGHSFRTKSDTEVILEAYVQWGSGCFRKFLGMFSLAIWDRRREVLLLARDRLGIKPIYYHFKDNTFLFASELKALMAFPFFQRNLELSSIPLFLHYQYVPTPGTVFRDTFKLPPGQFLEFESGEIRTFTYWAHPSWKREETEERVSENDRIEDLDRVLTAVVRDHMVSDVPLGALLSGGIDSSLVVALMQKVDSAPLRTFSLGFREHSYDEAPFAAKVAKYLGTDHYELYLGPAGALDVIPRLAEIYDEPFADSSAIPTFLICQLARSKVTVALSGDGGDEQFAGYVRYWSTKAAVDALQHIPLRLRQAAARALCEVPVRWIERSYLPLYQFLPQRFQVMNLSNKWAGILDILRAVRTSDIYRVTICQWPENEIDQIFGAIGLRRGQYEEAFGATEGWPLLTRLMWVDQKTYLPDAMLTKVDRASMSVGLEVRVPLLDHRFLEYTSALPENIKYRGGKGKYLLKKVLARYLPVALFERPKKGFGVPLGEWLRTGLRELLLDHLSFDRIKKEGLFDPATVERKVREHLAAKANHQYQLWPLLVWEMWRERWLSQ